MLHVKIIGGSQRKTKPKDNAVSKKCCQRKKDFQHSSIELLRSLILTNIQMNNVRNMTYRKCLPFDLERIWVRYWAFSMSFAMFQCQYSCNNLSNIMLQDLESLCLISGDQDTYSFKISLQKV